MGEVINKKESNICSDINPFLDIYEAGRSCRSKRKIVDSLSCPVCSASIRASDLNSHLTVELEKLSKLNVSKQRRIIKNSVPLPGSSKYCENSKKSWETYQTVKSNRQERLKLKSKKRKANEVTCPICNNFSAEDVTLHVEMCLQQMEARENSDDENIDVEGDDDKFEEYEWAGQTRVRASSLLQGGYTSLGIGTTITKSTAEEEEVEVIIDDDVQIYGSPHYTDEDVINARMENCTSPINTTSSTNENKALNKDTKSNVVVIDSLKMKIRELENYEETKELYKCLICLGRYNTPVVSVCCWHVYCEQCWLRTLAVKRICPQCNMITSPSELRRIYI